MTQIDQRKITLSADLELTVRLPKVDKSSSHTRICSDDYDDDDDHKRISDCIIEDEEECNTPKSPQHLIPRILTCPPAPKKKQSSRKRIKLFEDDGDCQFKFFEMVSREEVESFFRVVELNFNGSNKRKYVV